MKAEGFTREPRLDPRRLDDAAIESIWQKVQNAGIFVSSLDPGRKSYRPRHGKRETQNQYAMQTIELAGKLGVAYTGRASGAIKGAPLAQQVDEIFRVYTEKLLPACHKYKVR